MTLSYFFWYYRLCSVMILRSSRSWSLNVLIFKNLVYWQKILKQLIVKYTKIGRWLQFHAFHLSIIRFCFTSEFFVYFFESFVFTEFQETATSFIERLSDEYAAYVDIAQPIQVAVYEMKLGLSLVFSNALQNTFSDMIGGISSSQIMVE